MFPCNTMGKRRSALAPKEVPPEAELPADVLATEEDFTVFFFILSFYSVFFHAELVHSLGTLFTVLSQSTWVRSPEGNNLVVHRSSERRKFCC